jgi:calcium-dependent protein kinase
LKTNFDLKQLLKIQKEYFVFNYGSNIKDLYSFRKILGEGGYGKVYKAKHRKSNQSRAIKTIPKNKIINVDRFKNEVDALKKLDHPNVIKLQDIYEDSTRVYL